MLSRRIALVLGSLLLACATTAGTPGPIVIAHRGASGERPEHTLAAYALAIEQGADFIEADLVPTRDGHLVARHENELSGTTDVARRPEFAARRTTKTIDGREVTGWFSEDFTLAEIGTLRAIERIPEVRPSNRTHDGRYAIPTLEEIIALVRQADADGRRVGLYLETKHPTWFAHEGQRLDGTPIALDTSRRLVEILVAEGFTDPARLYLQSFEVANLVSLAREILPAAELQIPLVQLLGDVSGRVPGFDAPWDVGFHARNGEDLRARYGALGDCLPGGLTGDTRYGALATPNGLRCLATHYADGIGPWKVSLLPRRPLTEAERSTSGAIRSQRVGAATSLAADARAAGLVVHPYTLRAEAAFRSLDAAGAPQSLDAEIDELLALGIDGFFIDQPGAGVRVRNAWREGREAP